MNKQSIKIIASILFLLVSFVCIAQTGGPPPPQPPPPPGLPADGGVFVAMGLGLFYGVYKLLKSN